MFPTSKLCTSVIIAWNENRRIEVKWWMEPEALERSIAHIYTPLVAVIRTIARTLSHPGYMTHRQNTIIDSIIYSWLFKLAYSLFVMELCKFYLIEVYLHFEHMLCSRFAKRQQDNIMQILIYSYMPASPWWIGHVNLKLKCHWNSSVFLQRVRFKQNYRLSEVLSKEWLESFEYSSVCPVMWKFFEK